MKIIINAIPPEGMDIDEEISPEDLHLETAQIHFSGPVKVKAHVEKEKDIVTVRCRMSAFEKQQCSRCLADFDLVFDKEEDFVFKTEGEYTIDLNESIKDSIILEYPIRMLCKGECKGLCFQCGKNLNEGPCGCKKPKDDAEKLSKDRIRPFEGKL